MGSDDEELDDATLLGEGGGHKSRRAKARRRARGGAPSAPPPPPPPPPAPLPAGVTLEYEAAPVEGALGSGAACDPALAGMLAAFRRAAGVGADGEGAGAGAGGAAAAGEGADASDGEGDLGGDALGGAAAHLPGGLTRKQRRSLLQDFVTVVKSRVARPDVVEAHDVTSTDPALLVHLKALRHSVPVPRHWCHLKRYLQGKRGLPRPAYQLPAYVAATGIGTLRDLDNEAADKKSLKGKTRDRARPKAGRLEIDYSLLHDAFFVHQTKPPMTGFGELYYEGKEFEKDRSGFAPGALSDRLREALGMPPSRGGEEGGGGGAAPPVPPPWLVNMQRYGPPPSYPGLPVPGVSAPLPPGGAYGYGPGQWGAPPTDQFGFPLYGDVFGVGGSGGSGGGEGGKGAALWGEPASGWAPGGGGGGAAAAARAAREAAALEEALAPPEAPAEEAPAPAPAEAAPAAPGTDTSISAAGGGGVMELRKNFQKGGAEGAPAAAGAAAAAGAPPPPQLYAVLPERATALSGGLLGTRAVYDLSGGGGGGGVVPVAAAEEGGARRAPAKEVAIAIAPEELARLSEVELARRFDEETARAAAAAAAAGNDVSDLLEEQARKQKRKLAAKEEGEGGGGKKRKKGESFRF
jgi:splicing factor 3B subunit 2